MRIWDIDPGYLSRGNLLGEHRELHAILSIIEHDKTGYANHPETRRWRGHDGALRMRHAQLAAEMSLRSYTDRTPVPVSRGNHPWPNTYIDPPEKQFAILARKYAGAPAGRIPLPRTSEELWSHHKYSIMARDPERARRLGRAVARRDLAFSDLASELVELLRVRPSEGGTRNAALHMWGHVSHCRARVPAEHGSEVSAALSDTEAEGGGPSGDPPPDATAIRPGQEANPQAWPLDELLAKTQRRALEIGEPYLIRSTALAELAAWLHAVE